jgi:hypothetical protein
MKPPSSAAEEEEDATKAEENKLINEVGATHCPSHIASQAKTIFI